jgi:mitochondrial import inner membrane translocase subunit TIM21
MASNVHQGGVAYFLYSDVFSPQSKVSHFNKAVDRIKRDQRCIDVLGDPKKISAHGEETWNRWRRARPIAYGPISLAMLNGEEAD